MSLRTKFTLYISALVLFVVLGISYSTFFTQKKLLLTQLEESRTRIFEDFTYTCKDALLVDDEILVLNTIRSIIKTHRPAIVYAGYISPAGTILFSSRDMDLEKALRARVYKADSTSTEDFVLPNEEVVHEMARPLYITDEYQDPVKVRTFGLRGDESYRGTIKVGFSQSYLEKQVRDGLAVIRGKIAHAAVIALIAGFALANLLAFYLNKPIRALAKAADSIGDGNLDSRVSIRRNDELGKLGRTFNEMARKLKEIDELKDGFVSSVSHELRSPLAAIDGYCDYLLEGLAKNMPAEKQEKSLRIIKEATIRLTNFINNILDLAKIKAERFEIKRMPVNMNELAGEIVSLFESLAAQQKKRLVLDLQPQLPSVDADPEKMKQVITNLIGNALKFTPEDAVITVGARFAEKPRSGADAAEQAALEPRFVEVWVADTGQGVPREALDRIFDRFYQVKESDMKKPKGTGLGLAIVAEIVRMHNGRIWAESTLGKGATFRFTVPVWKNNV